VKKPVPTIVVPLGALLIALVVQKVAPGFLRANFAVVIGFLSLWVALLTWLMHRRRDRFP
jgi:uncharacterized membrane protein